MAAQIYAIIADAFDTLDDDNQAGAAILAGRERLRGLSDNESVRNVQLRLSLVAADAAESRPELLNAAEDLTRLEQTVPSQGLGHACLLLVRSRLEARLNRYDEAVKDGIDAYGIATVNRNPSASADAAYQLAMAYRRAGLFEDGKRRAQEAVDYNRKTGQLAALANALFVKAQILGDIHEFESALATISEARKLSVESGEPIGVAFDDQERCNELLSLNRLDEAQRACESAESGWAVAGRDDQKPATEDNLARIDLLRGRYIAALVRLNSVLGPEMRSVPPIFLPRLYHDRSVALAHLARYRDAYRDITESIRLADVADAEQRSLAAGAMKARLHSEKVELEKGVLQTRILLEQQNTASERRQKRLMVAMAVAASILAVLMAYVMRSRSRHERAMRRVNETVDTHARVIATINEGVLLINEKDRIEYANPSLLLLLNRQNEALIGMPVEHIGISPYQLEAPAEGVFGGLPAGSQELHVRAGNGGQLVMLLTTSRLLLHDRVLRVCVLQDVTRLRRLERAVRASASSERDRLSDQVHEGVAQDLTGMALLLKSIRGASQTDVDTIKILVGYLNEATQRTRAVAAGLAPVQMAGGSLEVALSKLAVEMSAITAVRMTGNNTLRELDLIPTHAASLYEIVRECLESLAHGFNCREVNCDLRVIRDDLVLTTTGDRTGGLAKDLPREFELETIAYLARIIGGTALFSRDAAIGSRITVMVPLANLAAGVDVAATV